MTTLQHANDDAPPYPAYEWTSTNTEEPPNEKDLHSTTPRIEDDALTMEERHEIGPNYYEDDHLNRPTTTRLSSYSEDDQQQITEQPLTDAETPLVREARGGKGWTKMQDMGM